MPKVPPWSKIRPTHVDGRGIRYRVTFYSKNDKVVQEGDSAVRVRAWIKLPSARMRAAGCDMCPNQHDPANEACAINTGRQWLPTLPQSPRGTLVLYSRKTREPLKLSVSSYRIRDKCRSGELQANLIPGKTKV